MDDFAKAAASFGVILGNSTSTPELRGAIERAQRLCEGLNDLHIRLTSHLDRILGVEPDKMGDATAAVPQPDCEMSALRTALSDMADAENRIRTQVERLARL